MDVCGIDPGLGTTGYAVIRAGAGSLNIIEAGVLTTNSRTAIDHRLIELADGFREVLRQWEPAVVGVEQLYAHYKHPRTAVQMAHARGVLLETAARTGASIRHFSATHIKRYLTGNGRASKLQIQRAIQTAFNLAALPEPNDVADALAVGVCCARDLADARLEAAV